MLALLKRNFFEDARQQLPGPRLIEQVDAGVTLQNSQTVTLPAGESHELCIWFATCAPLPSPMRSRSAPCATHLERDTSVRTSQVVARYLLFMRRGRTQEAAG